MSETNVQKLLREGNDLFTAKRLYRLMSKNPSWLRNIKKIKVLYNRHFRYSPLAQLALASVGPSHDEILSAIGMPNEDELIKEVFSDLNNRSMLSVKGVELKQANKVYVRNGYTLNDEFATISRTIFHSEVQNINFKDSKAAADKINEWVEANTNNRIKNLVDASTISEATAAILVNAIFFKGKWKTPFQKSNTVNRDFFITKDISVKIPLMYQSDCFQYGVSSKLDAKLLEMSYEGSETSFVVVLPNKYDGIESLVDKLKDPNAFSEARSTLYKAHVRVTLPKFKIETTTDLKKVLQQINIKRLFEERQAHLNKLIKDEVNVFVSDAVQKAFIEVDEQGTEAAAANKFGMCTLTSVRGPVYQTFNADHPFVFYLMHHSNMRMLLWCIKLKRFNGIFRS